ncbi:hypothetical protein ACFQWH_13670 [Mycolicibacterium sp. GCM10028919]|uniref:hypothetical protein n=1 Tax=Mycolicibacterium sp. GCM10028919 TaxID=3273401 RepID=UPI003615E96C
MRSLGEGGADADDWIAARRLVSAFHRGAVDNVVVDEIDAAGRWKAVALALVGEVAAIANHVSGSAQDFLDQRLTPALDRDRQTGEP